MPATDATLTILPQRRVRIPGTTCRQSRTALSRFVSIIFSHMPSSASRTGPKCTLVAALLTRMSTCPKAASAVCTNVSMSCGLPTLAATPMTSAPASRSCVAAASTSSAWRAASTTRAPAPASAAPIASPMPREPPVTSAVRPVRSKDAMLPLLSRACPCAGRLAQRRAGRYSSRAVARAQLLVVEVPVAVDAHAGAPVETGGAGDILRVDPQADAPDAAGVKGGEDVAQQRHAQPPPSVGAPYAQVIYPAHVAVVAAER